LIILDDDEENYEEPKTDKHADDIGGGPGFGLATPLECEDVADCTGHDCEGSREIHL